MVSILFVTYLILSYHATSLGGFTSEVSNSHKMLATIDLFEQRVKMQSFKYGF